MPADPRPRAIFIGDSQLEGLQPHLRTAFADLFQIIGVYAQHGASTRVIVDSGKIDDFVNSQAPDFVVFVLGGNDTAGGASATATSEAVRHASAHGAEVIWVGPAHAIDEATDQRHQATTDQQQRQVPGLPNVRAWLNSREWTNEGWGPDGVHFTTDAYATQAMELARRIASLEHGLSPLAVGLGIATGIAVVTAIGWGVHNGLSKR